MIADAIVKAPPVGLQTVDPYRQALRTFIRNQRSPCTRSVYKSNLRNFGLWLAKPLEAVTIGDVVDYKTHLLDQGLGNLVILCQPKTL